MRTLHFACWMIGAMAATFAVPAQAQQRPDPAALLAAQREAMATFAFMDGVWRVAPGKDPVRFFEMTLKRIGDSDWPQAGAVPPR